MPKSSSPSALLPVRRGDLMPNPETGYLGLVGLIVSIGWLQLVELPDAVIWLEPASYPVHWRTFIVALMTALPMITYEVFMLRQRARAGLQAPDGLVCQRSADPARCATKYLGLILTILATGFLYWLLPMYHDAFVQLWEPGADLRIFVPGASESRPAFYQPYFEVVLPLVPLLLLLAPFYIICVDARLSEPRDAFWQVGRVAMGKWQDAERGVLANHFGSWIIKAFFLPLMFTYLMRNVGQLTYDSEQAARLAPYLASWFLYHYDYLVRLLFTVDLAYAAIGYVCTFRLFQSHIRSVQPTVLGWLSAMACYQPFYGVLGLSLFAYTAGILVKPNRHWVSLFENSPGLLIIWGVAILAAIAFYAWATLAFGLRFSNLTNRGIIDYGPYFFTKHPAYVAKITTYALTVMPFVPQGSTITDWLDAVQRTILLGLVAGLYYIRAKTEEAHLWESWAYRRYAVQVRRRQRRWFGWLRHAS